MKIKNDEQLKEVIAAADEYLVGKDKRYLLFMEYGNGMSINGVLASSPIDVCLMVNSVVSEFINRFNDGYPDKNLTPSQFYEMASLLNNTIENFENQGIVFNKINTKEYLKQLKELMGNE